MNRSSEYYEDLMAESEMEHKYNKGKSGNFVGITVKERETK